MNGAVNGRGERWKGVRILGKWKDMWLEKVGWVDGGTGTRRDC